MYTYIYIMYIYYRFLVQCNTLSRKSDFLFIFLQNKFNARKLVSSNLMFKKHKIIPQGFKDLIYNTFMFYR